MPFDRRWHAPGAARPSLEDAKAVPAFLREYDKVAGECAREAASIIPGICCASPSWVG